ncbi:hypothetical protein PMIN01_03915 [Paraphaeosphaeria minitans]|uniref:Uncharacterized protein n=1 Tax=Paraphaeosphaeria minitans TaxID=565426 RepID=A0A9P6GMW5_9PLEO|nr:hypothetical protein PMIN01_03915 [Paraphaeosphaeria minitans]
MDPREAVTSSMGANTVGPSSDTASPPPPNPHTHTHTHIPSPPLSSRFIPSLASYSHPSPPPTTSPPHHRPQAPPRNPTIQSPNSSYRLPPPPNSVPTLPRAPSDIAPIYTLHGNKARNHPAYAPPPLPIPCAAIDPSHGNHAQGRKLTPTPHGHGTSIRSRESPGTLGGALVAVTLSDLGWFGGLFPPPLKVKGWRPAGWTATARECWESMSITHLVAAHPREGHPASIYNTKFNRVRADSTSIESSQ